MVYPRAIAALSKRYRFRGLGGASAGAMAAAAAAAAELGRQTGHAEAFEALALVSEDVAKQDFILGLFPPQAKARPLVRAGMAWRRLVRGRGWGRLPLAAAGLFATLYARVLAIWVGWGLGLLLVAAGMWPTVHFIRSESGPGVWWAVLVLLIAVGLGTAVGLTGGVIWHLSGLMRWLNKGAESHFGLSTGREAGWGLVDWLDCLYQELAGRPQGTAEDLITFGDLAEQQVDLRMVTTRLDAGHPIILSASATDGRGRRASPVVFSAVELERLFAPHVVAHLVAHAGTLAPISLPPGYHRLSLGATLPVVVAVRMSLSFPVLLSAVPLYTISDEAFAHARTTGEGQIAVEQLHRVWFSDGGIAANMPVSLFDDWLPSRPTLGITLRDGRPQGGDDGVRLLQPGERVDARPAPRAIHSLWDFIASVVDSARSYRDNDQSAMASYRERIVQVYLSSNEGGLNLDMQPQVVRELAARGGRAGGILANDFDFRQHQWVRLRLLLGHLEENLGRLWVDLDPELGFEAWVDQLLSEQLAFRESDAAWYRPGNEAWLAEARTRLEPLYALMQAWSEAGHFEPGRPEPYGVMRVASEL